MLVETLTGRSQDAAVRHRLRRALRPFLDEPTAVAAAELRAHTPTASVVDAVVAATAVALDAAAVVASDPLDLEALLVDADVRVERV